MTKALGNARHRHHMEKREYVTEYATAYTTIFVGAGETPVATEAASSATPEVTSAAAVAQAAAPVSSAAAVSSAAPAASSVSSASASATSSSSSGGKRGIAWDPANPDSAFSTLAESLSWFYNWNADAWGLSSSSLTFIPTIRTAADVDSVSSIADGSTLFTFNEPDNAGQAAMDVSTAVSLFKSNITPYKGSKISYLGSPSVTNGDTGLPWLSEFMSECSDCGVDFINIHWYGVDIDSFKSYVEEVHSTYPSMNIWITELACTNWDTSDLPSAEEVDSFFSAALSFLDSCDYVEKYAWYGVEVDMPANVGSNNLLISDANGDLTELGKEYVA